MASALQIAAAGTVMGVEESSLRALVKLERVMPTRLRRRTDALRSAILPEQRILPPSMPACARWSRMRWCTPATTGTWWPGTRHATTGAPSASTATLEPIDATRCLMRCGAGQLDSLVYWLMALDVEFDVLEPAVLKERLRVASERVARSLARAEGGHAAPAAHVAAAPCGPS